MRVLFVVEHFHPFVGGGPQLFNDLARALTRRGHMVTVVTTRLPGTPAVEQWEGVTIHRVATPPFSRRYWFTLLALIPSIWRARHADVIQTSTYTAAFPAVVAGWLLRRPVVLTVHEVWGARWYRYGLPRPLAWLYAQIEQLVIRLPVSRLIAVSNATARDLAHDRRSSTGITTIMNGIDTELFRRRPRPERRTDAFTFLYFGRPGVSKGIEHLIEAMRHLVRTGIQAKLRLILGTDPHDRYVAIAQAAQEPELRKVVCIDAPIPRSELPEAIAAADCVVVPSLAEGFGFTAVEACAVGTPLVCTNVEPLPDVVSGKVVFVPPGNPEELARGMRAMLEGRYEVIPDRNFSWERAARKYEAVYGEVVR